MVIQIAGTSGSGKSHLVREFLNWAKKHGEVKEHFVSGRKPPLGYLVKTPFVQDIFVFGAYDGPTGGCDTIRDVKQIFELIYKQHKKTSVLFEGLFVMNHTRGPALAAEVAESGDEFFVIQLTTPYATCLASINDRRALRGEDKLLNKDNTKGNWVRAANYCKKMRSAGAQVIKVRREDGLVRLRNLLG